MSIEIAGNNNYEVPLIEAGVGAWEEVAERCDPLLRSIVIAGLSAVCHGIRHTPDAGVDLDEFALGELFDASGNFTDPALYQRVSDDWLGEPGAEHYSDQFVAGVQVAQAALAVSPLLSGRHVENRGYTGQTGVRFMRRAARLAIGNSYEAGNILNMHPPQHIQVQATAPERRSVTSSVDLDFAAVPDVLEALPRGATLSLRTHIDPGEGTAQAAVTSAVQEGAFVYTVLHSDFTDIGRYIRVIAANLQAGA